MPTHKPAPDVMDDLAAGFRGELVVPGDAAYDEARRRDALISRLEGVRVSL